MEATHKKPIDLNTIADYIRDSFRHSIKYLSAIFLIIVILETAY